MTLHAVFADDEHGVSLVIPNASPGGRNMNVNAVHVIHRRDGKIMHVCA